MVTAEDIEERINDYMEDLEPPNPTGPNRTKFLAINDILDQANEEGNQEVINNVLIYATENQRVVRLIIEKGGNVNYHYIYEAGVIESTPMIMAATNQMNFHWRQAMIESLLEAGADPSQKVLEEGEEKNVVDFINNEIERLKNKISRANEQIIRRNTNINNNPDRYTLEERNDHYLQNTIQEDSKNIRKY